MSKQSASHFDKHGFEKALYSIPDHVILEIAKDGVVCSMELVRLGQLMALCPEHMQALNHHHQLIANLVLRYASKRLRIPVDKNLCMLNKQQAVNIFKHLLDEGLIEKYYSKMLRPSAPSATPGMYEKNQEKNR